MAANQKIIHLSDLHVQTRDKEKKIIQRVFRGIGKNYPGVPVLVTGDVTDSATAPQMKAARRLMDTLATTNPVLLVPGNHDYAWKGNILRHGSYEDWKKYLGCPLGWPTNPGTWMDSNHAPVGVEGLGILEDGPCVYFGIDSGDPDDKEVSARGYISEHLADNLKTALETYSSKTRIAFLHHHPFAQGLFTKLNGSEKLMNALRGNCELLLFGHEHNYGIWWGNNTIPLIVASHKTTNRFQGDQFLITIIEIADADTSHPKFWHRLELV